jgi:adenylylsulfate kinase
MTRNTETPATPADGTVRRRPGPRFASGQRLAAERGVVVWVTGLPASGKSTFGRALVEALKGEGRGACLLDGDEVRAAMVPRRGYDDAGRDAFYGTLAGFAALLAHQGLTVVVAATAHRRAYRERARELSPAFVEVFVDLPRGECRRRDDKGLYEGAEAGAVHDLPGLQLEYEAPERPDVIVRHGSAPATIAEAMEVIRKRSVGASAPRTAPRERPATSPRRA